MLFTPSSPCHKLSHLLGPPTPSSVTYFMDGPILYNKHKVILPKETTYDTIFKILQKEISANWYKKVGYTNFRPNSKLSNTQRRAEIIDMRPGWPLRIVGPRLYLCLDQGFALWWMTSSWAERCYTMSSLVMATACKLSLGKFKDQLR